MPLCLSNCLSVNCLSASRTASLLERQRGAAREAVSEADLRSSLAELLAIARLGHPQRVARIYRRGSPSIYRHASASPAACMRVPLICLCPLLAERCCSCCCSCCCSWHLCLCRLLAERLSLCLRRCRYLAGTQRLRCQYLYSRILVKARKVSTSISSASGVSICTLVRVKQALWYR